MNDKPFPPMTGKMSAYEMEYWLHVLYQRSEKLEERIAELERKEANVVKYVSDELVKNIRRLGYQIQ